MKIFIKSITNLLVILCLINLINCGNEHPQDTFLFQKNTPNRFHKFKESIPNLMTNNNIPGISVAIVNKDSTLWADAFGVLSTKSQKEVNTESVFSLQSISKAVTATAVMFAVQEGLVTLDTPIIKYLPDFTVGSRFEEHPERKITLRHLLSHRAGFTHEAPIGNNYQTEFDSFEQHIESISKTWLKAPVGKGPIYSNLGIDLAGYILQVRSNISFADYVKTRLFNPLGMKHSSFDWKVIRENNNRAIGHDRQFRKIPLEYALIPSGACYTNVLDMAKFVQFHLNKGKYNNDILLGEKYLDEMYRIPFSENEEYGLALGIAVYERAGNRCFRHGGGGFGFLTSLQWCPYLNIGIVVLTNSSDHNGIDWSISELILEKLNKEKSEITEDKNVAPTPIKKQTIDLSHEEFSIYCGDYVTLDGSEVIQVIKKGSQFGGQGKDKFIPFLFYSKNGEFYVEGYGSKYDGDYQIVLNNKTNTPRFIVRRGQGIVFVFYFNEKVNDQPGPNKPSWKKYTGKYSMKMYGREISKHKISIKNGYLFFDAFRLIEHMPKLFYAPNGEVLDFRDEILTYRNIKLYKNN